MGVPASPELSGRTRQPSRATVKGNNLTPRPCGRRRPSQRDLDERHERADNQDIRLRRRGQGRQRHDHIAQVIRRAYQNRIRHDRLLLTDL